MLSIVYAEFSTLILQSMVWCGNMCIAEFFSVNDAGVVFPYLSRTTSRIKGKRSARHDLRLNGLLGHCSVKHTEHDALGKTRIVTKTWCSKNGYHVSSKQGKYRSKCLSCFCVAAQG